MFWSGALKDDLIISAAVIAFLFLCAWIMIFRGMRGTAHTPTEELPKAFRALVDALKQLLGRLKKVFTFTVLAFRVYVAWPLKKPRRVIHVFVIVIFLCCGFVSAFEILKRFHLGSFLATVDPHQSALRRFRDIYSSKASASVDSWLDRSLHKIWVNVGLLLIELAVLIRHISELAEPKDPKFWETFQLLLVRVNGLKFELLKINLDKLKEEAVKKVERDQKLEQFFDAVSKGFRDSFERRGINGICISIMELDKVNTPEFLKIIFANAGEGLDGKAIRDIFDSEFKLLPGQGGSGMALDKGRTVYIPSIRTGHAVLMTEKALWSESGYELKSDVYYRSVKEPFQSMVCVPIPNGDSKPLAVLNLSSADANAFLPRDFQMAWRAALIVSLGLNP